VGQDTQLIVDTEWKVVESFNINVFRGPGLTSQAAARYNTRHITQTVTFSFYLCLNGTARGEDGNFKVIMCKCKRFQRHPLQYSC
jgi:hypothetical protein